jgi:hypothetical protein
MAVPPRKMHTLRALRHTSGRYQCTILRHAWRKAALVEYKMRLISHVINLHVEAPTHYGGGPPSAPAASARLAAEDKAVL